MLDERAGSLPEAEVGVGAPLRPAYLNPQRPPFLSQSCVIRILANGNHQSTG